VDETVVMANPRMVSITLYVEADDDADVERLSDAVARVACPEPADAATDHSCPIPWFVVTAVGEDLESWRELLNR
jgi:hypothetical protein